MKKILIIDDDEGLRTELIQVLGFEGYEAIGAENGHEGILTAQQHLPHLIVCDINMPILNGFAVIKELRQDPKTEHTPVIFLSATNEQSAVQHGMQLGVVAYLPKPCSLEKFLSVIRSQIGS
jgi:CheY-like chemotaxis protein